jgi:hypothetical protein
MTRLDSDTAPLVIGDDFDVIREVTNIDDGDSLVEARLTIKEDENDSDEDASVRKFIDPAGGADGQITDPGSSAGTGEILFELSHEDTAGLLPYKVYSYDIQVKTEAGKIFTRERGILIPKAQVTISE